MASRLIDEDPELAHLHALSAARRAGRIAVVRETLAITAYETGDYALALRELRTFRRISGSDEQLPLMVDSERGVGRPEKALELGRSVERSTLTPATQVSLAIAMSGARLDLGSPELALGELEIPQLDPERAFSYSPALYDAYAEVLSELGRVEDAAVWRKRAAVALQLLGDPNESETIEIVEEEIEGFEEADQDPDAGADTADGGYGAGTGPESEADHVDNDDDLDEIDEEGGDLADDLDNPDDVYAGGDDAFDAHDADAHADADVGAADAHDASDAGEDRDDDVSVADIEAGPAVTPADEIDARDADGGDPVDAAVTDHGAAQEDGVEEDGAEDDGPEEEEEDEDGVVRPQED
ncbi:hypothetical protein [Labedella phragmitis]|uniref:hypothetical protein n=1 Tax=Labedella phragmitis TaxID=2498849 RepID=UPI001FB82227|nr:hypothetical protein [Labedella phragmitis]